MKLATFVIVAITGLARIGDTQATPEKAGAAPGTTPAEQSVARKIDLAHSTLTVRVYKSGLFSAFAHDHEIKAPIIHGQFTETRGPVEFLVDARQMKVMDPEASAKDRAEIQETMLGPKVLDSQKSPEITFRSSSVENSGTEQWAVVGDLTIRGQTKSVRVDVQRKNGRYLGSAKLKQTDFGITPISIAGGAVKVKDEIKVEFDIAGE